MWVWVWERVRHRTDALGSFARNAYPRNGYGVGLACLERERGTVQLLQYSTEYMLGLATLKQKDVTSRPRPVTD